MKCEILQLKTDNIIRLFTKMSAFSTFIDFVKSVVVLVDSTVGQYAAIYNICTIDGGYFLKNFFSCDIPVNLNEYLMIHKFLYWSNISRSIIQKAVLYKIDNSLMHSFYIKKNAYNNLILINTLNSKYINLHYHNQMTTNSVEYEYMLRRFITEYNNLFSCCSISANIGSRAMSHVTKLWQYAISPVSLNITYNFWFFNKISTTIGIITQRNIFIVVNIITTLFFFVYFSLFFFNFFVKLVKTLSSSVFLMQKLTKEQDQEVTSFEDLLIFIVFFCTFFINSLNLYTNTALIQYNLNITFWMLFVYFFSLIIIVPTSIIIKTGSNCFLYIKGSDKYNSMSAYATFDIITLLAFFLRFFLQIIRWCLFLTTYYLLHEFVFEWIYGLFLNLYNQNSVVSNVFMFMNSNAILQLFVHIIRFTFELLDTCLILTIQITAFIAVILWLFNYLFSLSLDDIYESLFENKIVLQC